MSGPPGRAEPPRAGFERLSSLREISFPDDWYDLTSPRHFWFQWRAAALVRQLDAVGLPRGEPLRALEVGGGTGVLRDQLEAATRWTVDIADVNLRGLEHASSGRGRNLYYDVSDARPELLEAYDVGIAFDVLEHVADTRRFLGAVLRHVRPGGMLLVNVPAGSYLYSAYDVAAGHLRRYDKPSLSQELLRVGLEPVDLRYWGFSLVPLLLLRKALLGREPGQGTIWRGFHPPGRFAHAVLRALMRLETGLVPRPPFGTSLLLAGHIPARAAA